MPLLCHVTLSKSPSVQSPSFPSSKMGLAWVVFQDPWALTLKASVPSSQHKREPQQVLEEEQSTPEPWYSHLLAFPGDPSQTIAGVLRLCGLGLNVASAACHPSTPLESENNAGPAPTLGIAFCLEIPPGVGGRAGALEFLCLLIQEVAESLGPTKTSSRSSWKSAAQLSPGLGTCPYPQVGLSW